jgi:serine/threonine protein kinase
MLKALEFLHSKEHMICHRDIKPENILYNTEDHFVLADFSNARAGVPDPDDFAGCLEYLPPEVYARGPQSTAGDIWALGVLCLDILAMLPQTDVERRTFVTMKALHWTGSLCERANHSERPEIKMMVIEAMAERPLATEVLEFVRQSPATQITRYKPSEHLKYLIFKTLLAFERRGENKVREFSAAHQISTEY